MPYILVDPSSRLNWSHDWEDPLDPWLAEGDTITSRLWTITPLNNTTPETPVLSNTTSDIVFVEGLLPGRVYHLTEHVVTASGLEDDRTIVIRCEDT
jgi:hypothetical protein